MFWKNNPTPPQKPNTALELLWGVLNREIVWIDKTKMSEADLLNWSNEAKLLLENRVFQSLVGKTYPEKTNGEIVKSLIEHIAKHSQNWEEVRDLRSKIVGIELIREYAEECLIKKTNDTYDEINEAV